MLEIGLEPTDLGSRYFTEYLPSAGALANAQRLTDTTSGTPSQAWIATADVTDRQPNRDAGGPDVTAP